MYARTTTIHADPAKVDDGVAYVRDEVIPAITSMDGCVGMSVVAERKSGRCIATAAWASEEAMRASADAVRPYREEAERVLGASGCDVDRWEIAALHRQHALPDGACARLTWLTLDPTDMERAIDVFKTGVLPQAEALTGFCSASLLVDREAGHGVTTVVFERPEYLDASRDLAERIRASAAAEIGAIVDEVAEMDVVVAGLHAPELV